MRLQGKLKQMTSKPVVGVGRFTSPDTMVSQIRRGVLDFIGAARPSIADPFLPRKIEESIESVTAVGDCLAPGLIAHAVYSGHRYARELDAPRDGEVPFARRASQPRMP